jgi:hypothetical protein
MMNFSDFNLSKDNICQNCLSRVMVIFHELRSVPANSCIMLPTRREAMEYPKGDILLGFCPQCGFISNVAFDPKLTEYSERYEETQGFSPTFRKFHQELAGELIERYDLHGKTIIEIGCGKGEFLSLLCEMGGNRGTGFDPAYIDERNESEAANRIIFVKDYYSEKYSYYKGDFIVCKMTLEHIANTFDFMTMIKRSISNNLAPIIFIQVPDVTRILKETCFEDIYYEHCSYFSPDSMAALLNKCGLGILRLSRTFDDQYLMIEAQPYKNDPPPVNFQQDIKELEQHICNFKKIYQNKLASWQNKFSVKANGKRAVLWGSGSKAVAFLSALNIKHGIEYVIDINPYKHGFFLAGVGQRIMPPIFLKEYRPDIIIIMNAIYKSEIEKEINKMNITSEVISL